MPVRPPFPDVPKGYPFPGLERERLVAWRRDRVFERSLARPAPAGEFVFYEGPPTANNVPHVGHVVTRVVKDVIPRFRTMTGHHVARKAGWDTHGLPVEIEVEKRLGFSGKRQIEAYGIAEFNRACLESVSTYEQRWRAMTERVGYWIDLDQAYFTYTNDYVESVWWALAELGRNGLLAEDYKIQPYCARCGTTLSSHEVAQNYKQADDPSIWTIFRLLDGARARDLEGREVELGGVGLVGWTTTPWTTIANAAVAVHPDLLYRVIAHPAAGHEGERLLIAEGLEQPVPVLVERDGKRQVADLRQAPALARLRGRDLEGLLYRRLFEFFEPGAPGRVVLGDYVTATDGTGLVHTAPPFGEDDYQTGRRYGLPMILSVEADGTIAQAAGPFAGLWFKDADKPIVHDLKERGLLLHADRHRHNYPFCWRCDQPLLYFATKGWFVRTTARRDDLVRLNRAIVWHPAHVGEGRFGNWLENVVDWAISRRRYWGTPIPIWRCDACGEWEVVGGFGELFEKAGLEAPADLLDRLQFDPHRPSLDEERFSWSCPCGRGRRRRVPEVLDAWFDSGAMPFAQHHYRGEPVRDAAGRIRFDPQQGIGFPADFISEAVDQTRGWFYTLHALGALLFGQPAYRHCIVLGHVNDEQGRKMSKRLGNVVEPMAVIEETGADALRWYFCVSDPEQPSRFSARLVREAAQNFLLPLWNALSFFTIYANIDGWRPKARDREIPFLERPDLDQWILLRLDQVVESTTALLGAYAIAPAAREIERFVDDLTNWYIRRSRDRFWAGADAGAAKESAYQTLHRALVTLARLLAPFAPFVADEIHQRLVRSQDPSAPVSVHLEDWPEAQGWMHQARTGGVAAAPRLVQAMSIAQRIVGLGRAARAAHDIKTRQPLAGATLVFSGEAAGADLRDHVDQVRGIVLDELNVKELRWAERRSDFVRHEVRPNFRILGKRLGPRMKAVQAALADDDGDALAERLERDGAIRLSIDGDEVVLEVAELEIRLIEKEGMATANDRELLLALDTAPTPELLAEGRAREVIHRIQAERKDRDLAYTDRIVLRYRAAPEIESAIAAHRGSIAAETLALRLEAAGRDEPLADAPIDGLDFAFSLAVAG